MIASGRILFADATKTQKDERDIHFLAVVAAVVVVVIVVAAAPLLALQRERRRSELSNGLATVHLALICDAFTSFVCAGELPHMNQPIGSNCLSTNPIQSRAGRLLVSTRSN